MLSLCRQRVSVGEEKNADAEEAERQRRILDKLDHLERSALGDQETNAVEYAAYLKHQHREFTETEATRCVQVFNPSSFLLGVSCPQLSL